MSLLLSGRAQSRELLQNEILAYLSSLEDWERWKDYLESSTGKTLIDILTGISELLLYKLEMRSLDSYLPTSITKPAAYLLSQMVGYNPNRKYHSVGTVKVSIDLVNNFDFNVPLGFQFESNIPLVVSANTIFPKDATSVLVDVWQGEWVDVEFSHAMGNLVGQDWELLKLDDTNFSIDQVNVMVEVDGQLLAMVDKIEKVTANSVIVKTDYKGGAFLLFGDGLLGYRLRSSSVVKVRYLRTLGKTGVIPAGTQIGDYILDQQIIHVSTYSNVQGGTDEDTIEKVQYLASRFFQTQGRAVTRFDYEAIMMAFPGVVSAKAVKKDDECCTILICGLKNPLQYWSTLEVGELMAYLEDYKMLSSKLEFVQPQPVKLDIQIMVVVKPMFNYTSLEADIYQYIVDVYCNKLEESFYPTRMVDNITDMFPDIKRSYVRDLNGIPMPYTDIPLQFFEYFTPGLIEVTKVVEAAS